MNEPGITPLAQRLAEENNVDWRSLTGSGSDGRIVERDVLSYLARVMAGDEALDPTPEPMPEGMEAWPETEGFGADRISQASDAEDFGTAVVFDAAAAEEASEPDAPGDSAQEDAFDLDSFMLDDDEGDLELSEDIFLFGDESGSGLGEQDEHAYELPDVLDAAAGSLQDPDDDGFPVHGSLQEDGDSFDDESLLIADDEDFFGLSNEDSEPGAGAPEPLQEDDGFGFSVEPEEGLLGRTDDMLDDTEFEDADLTDLAMEDGELDDPVLSEDNLRAFEGTVGDRQESLEEQAGLDQELETELVPEEDFDIDFGQLTGWDEGERFQGEDSADSDEAVPSGAGLLAGEEPVPAPADNAESESGMASGYEAAFAAALQEATQPDEPVLPLADFGTLLRRRLDVTQLSQAQQAVGRELGLDGARSALPFLLRAAARALRQVEFIPADAAVAAAVVRDGRVSLVEVNDTGFRNLAAQLETDDAPDGAGSPAAAGLAVADMSSFEVDEAVLNLGMPVLTLGRALHDAETGTFRSTLTLSGHYDIEDGARFLQEASELLSNPLTLLI